MSRLNSPVPRGAAMQSGNQLAGRQAAEQGIEQAASKQYTAAWQFVYQPDVGSLPARGTPAYLACLSVSALRKAEYVRKNRGAPEEVDRLKNAARQWRRALMYPMMIQVIGKSMPEYTDAALGSSLDKAAEIISIPDITQPYYQGGLVLTSINRGTRVVGLFPSVNTQHNGPTSAPVSP